MSGDSASRLSTVSASVSPLVTLEVAMALSHRLYVMDQGRIQFEGTPDALRRDPTIQQRFLEI